MRAVIGHAKLVQVAFCGPFGVGKTTAVRMVSDTPVVNTDVMSSIRSRDSNQGEFRKRTTTVGLDYGEWKNPSGGTVAVVGTPGQERFMTMRQSAMPRSTSIVLWLYGDRDYAVDEGEEWVRFLGDEKVWGKLTLAITRRTGAPHEPSMDEYREMAHRFNPAIPVIEADPRERESVIRVILTALRLPVPELEAAE